MESSFEIYLSSAGVCDSTKSVLIDQGVLSRSIFSSLREEHFGELLPKLTLGQHALLMKLWDSGGYGKWRNCEPEVRGDTNNDIMCIANNKPFRNSPVPEHRLEHQQVDHLVLINKAYSVGACLIKALAYVPFISWFITGSKPIIFGFA